MNIWTGATYSRKEVPLPPQECVSTGVLDQGALALLVSPAGAAPIRVARQALGMARAVRPSFHPCWETAPGGSPH